MSILVYFTSNISASQQKLIQSQQINISFLNLLKSFDPLSKNLLPVAAKIA